MSRDEDDEVDLAAKIVATVILKRGCYVQIEELCEDRLIARLYSPRGFSPICSVPLMKTELGQQLCDWQDY